MIGMGASEQKDSKQGADEIDARLASKGIHGSSEDYSVKDPKGSLIGNLRGLGMGWPETKDR